MRKLHNAGMLWIVIGLLYVTTAWGGNIVNDVQVSHQFNKTRIVIAMHDKVAYHIFSLNDPRRIVIDLPQTQMHATLADSLYHDTPITHIRTARHPDGVLRMVFDIGESNPSYVDTLEPKGPHNFRLVVDLNYQAHISVAKPTLIPEVVKPDNTKMSNDKIFLLKPKITVPQQNTLRDVVVVLDPGHGGKDPGATGAGGTHEKDIVLAIGKELKQLIDAQPGMRAILTRTDDYYIPLRGRLGIARKDKADLFIAIHADAYAKTSSHGVSIFALSLRGASSEAARWLAERENYSELGGVDLNGLYDRSAIVRSVLLDLSQTATISASLKFGVHVLKQISGFAELHNRKVEQARFVVLKSPDIPSVLIETGFISNPHEEQLLGSSAYRHKLAAAILIGVQAYFWSEPPLGSYIYAWRNAKSIQITHHQRLDEIAKRYQVSVEELKQVNKLSSSDLRSGQVIRIPQAA